MKGVLANLPFSYYIQKVSKLQQWWPEDGSMPKHVAFEIN
jgi:hypothetical protein